MPRPPLEDDYTVMRAVSAHPDPFVTAADLVQSLEYKNARGLRNRLNDLTEKGLLNRKDVGARASVYWLSDDGREWLIERLSADGNQ